MPAIDHRPFNAELRSLIAANLRAFDDQRHLDSALRAAAVAVMIFRHDDQGAVILTRRASRLRDHGGQWALPGGRIDAGETAVSAALRELHEEVNLNLDPSAVLGTLDDYVTRSGFIITPVVVWAEVKAIDLTLNPDEVESIHPFTFMELMRGDSPNLEIIPESDRPVLSMNYLDDRIYSPTAAML
jgi:8-oxo-dGTP pyrophosphatase MutT (NUDIX family)